MQLDWHSARLYKSNVTSGHIGKLLRINASDDETRERSYICEALLPEYEHMNLPDVDSTVAIRTDFTVTVRNAKKEYTWVGLYYTFLSDENEWDASMMEKVYHVIRNSFNLEGTGFRVLLSVFHVGEVSQDSVYPVHLHITLISDYKYGTQAYKDGLYLLNCSLGKSIMLVSGRNLYYID